MSDGPTEQEIVRGLRHGDRVAWGTLCQRYGPRVWQYIARLVGSDEHAVADVLQETLLAVAKSGRGLAQETKLWAWLARIGHNQAALYWRKQYQQRRTDLPGDLADQSLGGDPIGFLEQLETVSGVRRLLAEMDGDDVALLTAKYLDGLSVHEIVELCGGTTEGVRSRLARARRDFRERYERLAGTMSSNCSADSTRGGAGHR